MGHLLHVTQRTALLEAAVITGRVLPLSISHVKVVGRSHKPQRCAGLAPVEKSVARFPCVTWQVSAHNCFWITSPPLAEDDRHVEGTCHANSPEMMSTSVLTRRTSVRLQRWGLRLRGAST